MLMLVPVVTGVVMAFGVALLATVDVVYFFGVLLEYVGVGLDPMGDTGERDQLRGKLIAIIVKVLDGYIIAALLFIFSFGLYELFIGKIDAAEDAETASRLLYVRSIDDLKDKVARLIMLILIIEFFQYALRMRYDEPLDLLFLAGGVLLISVAFHVLGRRRHDDRNEQAHERDG